MVSVPALSLQRELARKAIHLSTLAIPIAYAIGLPRTVLVILLAAGLLLAQAIELARRRSERIRAVVHGRVGALLREHEHHGWAGATWLVAAFLLVVVAFPRDVAIVAMIAVAAGDASAALVGGSIGRIRYGNSRKSLEGSLACMLVTVAGGVIVGGMAVIEAVVGGAAAAAAEAPSGPFDDNIRIAITTGMVILLWRLVIS